MLLSEFVSELIVKETGVTGAEMRIGIRQSPDLGYGEFCWAEKGVHICFLHHLLCELDAMRLREEFFDSFMAVLPSELENVPDDFLQQLEGLLDLGLNQWGEVNDSHIHLWLRDEGPSRDGEAVVDCAETLSHDGQTAPLFAASAGCQPLCHLFLERERESSASVNEGPGSVTHVLQPLNEQGGRDVEWEVPYDVEVWWISLPRLREVWWESSVHSVVEYVAVDDPQLPRCCLRQQLQPWDEACILLHHKQVRYPGFQDGARESPGTGTHLAYVGIPQIARLTDYFVCEPQVQQKVLGQLFLGSQFVQLYQLADSGQGRQTERR